MSPCACSKQVNHKEFIYMLKKEETAPLPFYPRPLHLQMVVLLLFPHFAKFL